MPTRFFLTEPPDATQEAVAEIKKQRLASSGPETMQRDILTELATPHIASPDVHVDTVDETIVMYFHGLDGLDRQVTRVDTSPNGIHFTAQPDIFSRSYLRAFTNDSHTYALVMPGQVYRFADGQYPLEVGPLLFNKDIRHSALWKNGDSLHVFWSQVGDVPERILMSTIDMSVGWREWRETESIEVLCPERPWEGASAPLEPSVWSVAYGNVNQLGGPSIFSEDDRNYLLYSVAGESGMGIAEIELP